MIYIDLRQRQEHAARMQPDILDTAINRINLKNTVKSANAVTTACGVYAILHRRSRKLYIGSTSCKLGIRARVGTHRRDLLAGRHCNRQLQHYFDRHGMASFDLLILREVAPEVARQHEQEFLDRYQPWGENGFNVMRTTDAYRTHSEATREAAASRASKTFALEFEGIAHTGRNLTEFCRLRGLHQGAMTQVLLGKKIQFKGWTLPGNSKPPRVCKYWPTGQLHSVPYYEGTKFAKSRQLDAASFNRVLCGTARIFKGWALAATDIHPEELEFSMLSRLAKCRINGRKSTGPKDPPRYRH